MGSGLFLAVALVAVFRVPPAVTLPVAAAFVLVQWVLWHSGGPEAKRHGSASREPVAWRTIAALCSVYLAIVAAAFLTIVLAG
jgi:hypothetical protein